MPLLKIRLAAAGKDTEKLSVGALYLGNWLTDMSQIIDPVAAGKLKTCIPEIKAFFATCTTLVRQTAATLTEELSSLSDNTNLSDKATKFTDVVKFLPLQDLHLSDGVTKLSETISDGVTKLSETIIEKLTRLEKSLTNSIERVVDSYSGDKGSLHCNLLSIVKVMGYLKFVQPKTDLDLTMDFEVYNAIFNARFTQYYPHEHLDRYPKDIVAEFCGVPGYSGNVANGTKTVPEKGGLRNAPNHLYSYLVDDIELAAGLLGRLDDEWAFKYFNPYSGNVPLNSDLDWNLGLAKLGHALHAIEDFFAHSNFVEFALALMNQLPENPSDLERHARRMFKFDGTNSDHPSNSSGWSIDRTISTGYFDFCDTLISLGHLLEPLLDPSDPPGIDELHKLIDSVTDTYYTVGNRTFVSRAEVQRLLAQSAVEKWPVEMQQAVVDFILFFDAIKLGKSLWDVISLIVEFVTAPEVALEKLLLDYELWADKEIFKIVLGPFLEAVGQMIGSYRVGSHSLLAKDEPESLHYEKQRQCSMAIHWYVVHTLTRWALDESVNVCRTDTEGAEINTINAPPYIDWLELLEHFLRHPAADLKATLMVKASKEVESEHMHKVTKGETLRSVVTRYRSLYPRYYKGLTCEDVVGANLKAFGNNPETVQQVWFGMKRSTAEDIANSNTTLILTTKLDGLVSYAQVTKFGKGAVDTDGQTPQSGNADNWVDKPLIPGLLLRLPPLSHQIEYDRLVTKNVTTVHKWWVPVLLGDWMRFPNYQWHYFEPTQGSAIHAWVSIQHDKLVEFYKAADGRHRGEFEAAYNASSPAFVPSGR